MFSCLFAEHKEKLEPFHGLDRLQVAYDFSFRINRMSRNCRDEKSNQMI